MNMNRKAMQGNQSQSQIIYTLDHHEPVARGS